MENNFKPKMLKSIRYYLSKAFKFHDIKGDYVAPLFFIVILAVNFLSYYLVGSENMNLDLTNADSLEKFKLLSSKVITIFFCINAVISVVSAGYLYAYICELRQRTYTLGQCITSTLKNSPGLLIAYLLLSIYIPMYAASLRLPGIWVFVAMGVLLLLAVPLFILYFMLIFSSSYIQDKSIGVFRAMKASAKLSKGHKVEVFSVILIIKFISFLLMFFTLSFVSAPGNELVRTFVESFLGTIITLVEVRIIALMYFDLEY